MITLLIVIGSILFLGACYAIHTVYMERFGAAFLVTQGAAFIYFAAILCFVVLIGMDGEIDIDSLHRIFTFQSEDWISGVSYFSLLMIGVGWWANVKESTPGWGFLTTTVQLAVGIVTAVLIALVALFFFNAKNKK
tara:strand:+ start:244 stop:651 length:408 start_codon:yes stop_codon:yes gene_type:complete